MSRSLPRGFALTMVAALGLLGAQPAQACWFTHCFGGETAYRPATPAYYAPTYSQAYYAPPVAACANPCNPCGVQQTCSYVPQTCYQPVTTYTPVTTLKPASSWCCCNWFGGGTSYKPVTTYVPQTSYMPVTTYQQVCNYASGCSTCGTSACDGGCGTTTAYYPTSLSAPAQSACCTPTASRSSISAPATIYSSTPSTSVPMSAPTPAMAPSSIRTFEPASPMKEQSLRQIVPEVKPEMGAGGNPNQNSSNAPRLLDPRDRTASMPVIRTWTGMPNARSAPSVQPASATSSLPTDEDGWHADRPR